MDIDACLACLKIHQTGSFTAAAKELGITQPALSLRIKKLEDFLQASLFIRQKGNLSMTSSGEKFLIYAKESLLHHEAFMSSFNQYGDKPAGVFRIAGFSSIVRSVLIKSLAPFLRNHSDISIEFSTHEMGELEEVLKRNQADLIFTDYYPSSPGLVTEEIGKEEYVLIQKKTSKSIPEVYLDHGPNDNATEAFFKHQGKSLFYKRGFMGDVYGILDGVKEGIGKAVMSKHLIKKDSSLKTIRTPKKYTRPIVYSHNRQAYYSPVQQLVVDEIKKQAGDFL